ncbi:MAG: rod shape-determining protein MreC [Bacilli bacterium]|jgi:rod shape-determining protein MreC|nr:rod shape-determining protein MreC [Bacilli bacterium]
MKLNKKHNKIEFRYILLLLIFSIVIIFTIFSFIINDNRSLSIPEQGIKDLIVNTQNILLKPFRYIANEIKDYKHKQEIYKKYKNNYDNSLYDGLKKENNELIREINGLKNLLNINNSYTEYDIVNATVINRNIGVWYNTLTIDKGSKDKLKKDMIAVINQNLIGKIIKITYTTSEIKLITTNDLKSKISVAVVNENEEITYGLISGYNPKSKHIIIDSIIDDTTINKGDNVITSGLSDYYPKGILVGQVAKIKSDELGIAKILEVKSNIDFNDIRFVSILIRRENHD